MPFPSTLDVSTMAELSTSNALYSQGKRRLRIHRHNYRDTFNGNINIVWPFVDNLEPLIILRYLALRVRTYLGVWAYLGLWAYKTTL